ncbi:hypothetical protein J5X84_04240 [Streptosporangiaceae bacterium NEAU-GS5]|nr:hypothetical protein [Streptosporangiaceae bacterium NEAU-GS5]
MATYGEIRRLLRETDARWQTAATPADDEQVPEFPLGASPPADLAPAEQTAPLDLAALLREHPTANPMLAARRVALGLAVQSVDPAAAALAEPLTGTDAAGASALVDWRNRWGTSWVTGVRDQNPCGACVAFGTTAVIESRTRIEHAVWTIRSEGDSHDGIGYKCPDGSWPTTYFDWIRDHGLADPGCWPWTPADEPYAPTPDRPGRTVKIDGGTALGSIQDQKTWIDTVGPVAACFAVYADFFAHTTGVYHRLSDDLRGWHCVAVIGYSDYEQAWICKNSWGPGWGDHGYFKIGYGEAQFDTYPKYGVLATNPDPLTKRRMHNGNLYESGNGAAHRNFEMLATADGPRVKHWWREGGAPYPWNQATEFGSDCAYCPTLTSTSYNRNFETVYLTTGGRLHHWWFDQNTHGWKDGGVFGPADAAGVPGFIQSNYGAPGNFEVVVRLAGGRLQHWWRDGGGNWHPGPVFAAGVAHSGATLIQGNYGGRGNFELVCVLGTGQMQHWFRANDSGGGWYPTAVFGGGVSSPPVMIQGQYGMTTENSIGNFELCVAAGGRVQHWWRNNTYGQTWTMSAVFGHDVRAVVGMVEGSFGFNLEIVVLRTDNRLQHYWRGGGVWNEGPVIGSI